MDPLYLARLDLLRLREICCSPSSVEPKLYQANWKTFIASTPPIELFVKTASHLILVESISAVTEELN